MQYRTTPEMRFDEWKAIIGPLLYEWFTEVVSSDSVSERALWLVSALTDVLDPDTLTACPRVSTLTHRAGLEHDGVTREAIAELVDGGWLFYERRPGFTSRFTAMFGDMFDSYDPVIAKWLADNTEDAA